MSRETRFDQRQAAVLLLAALLADSFLEPFGRQTAPLPARTAVWAGALRFGILCIVLFLYSDAWRRAAPGRVLTALLEGALVLSIALEVIQAERFYNYVMQQQLAAAAFLVLVFAAAYYGAFAGVQALGRAAWLVLTLTVLSVGVLAWSVAGQLRFASLQTPALDAAGLWDAAAGQFYLPPELALLPLLCGEQAKKAGVRMLGAAFAAGSLLAMLGEMTLGAAYLQTDQPVFAIARLGGISVFRRLDALHVGVWLLLFLLKIGLYFAAAVRLWHRQGRAGPRHGPYWVVLAGVMAVFLAVWNQREDEAFLLQQCLLAAVLALAAAKGWMRKERGGS